MMASALADGQPPATTPLMFGSPRSLAPATGAAGSSPAAAAEDTAATLAQPKLQHHHAHVLMVASERVVAAEPVALAGRAVHSRWAAVRGQLVWQARLGRRGDGRCKALLACGPAVAVLALNTLLFLALAGSGCLSAPARC